MTSKQLFFCCYNRFAIFFFSARAVQIFFCSNFFFARGGGLKLGLYVFHNNNKFNLIKIYSGKTITIEYKKITDLFTLWIKIYFTAQVLSLPSTRSTGPPLKETVGALRVYTAWKRIFENGRQFKTTTNTTKLNENMAALLWWNPMLLC